MEPKVVCLYEAEHIPLFEAFVQGKEHAPQALALSLDIEYLLEKKGIPFISAKKYRSANMVGRMRFVQTLAGSVFENSANGFSYRDIPLGDIFAFSLREYFNRTMYWAELFDAFAHEHQGAVLVYGSTSQVPQNGGPLSREVHDEVIHAARIAGKKNGFEVLVQVLAPEEKQEPKKHVVRDVVLRLLNVLVTATTRSRKISLVVADHWRNVGELVRALPDAEVCMVERRVLREISPREVWKHRIRFSPLDVKIEMEGINKGAFEAFAKNARAKEVSYHGLAVGALVTSALESLVRFDVPLVCAQIETAYEILAKRPAAVLLRTSTGRQTHYSVLALVAKALSVPGIEVQHGLEYLGEGSYSADHVAEYLAVYGERIVQDFEKIGYESHRLLKIGSPRFDQYKDSQPNAGGKILCVGPDIFLEAGPDSYDAEDYFRMFFEALSEDETPIIKLRSGAREAFYRESVARGAGKKRYYIETTKPFSEVLKEARVVVSCYSTAILESLQCGIPVVLLAHVGIEKVMDRWFFTEEESARAHTVVEDAVQLKRALDLLQTPSEYELSSQKARSYMKANFSFDGRATERLATFIRTLKK